MLTCGVEVVDGRRLRCARLGAGPAVVLLHGWPETLQLWSEVAPRLAATHEVFAPDWPGLGESDAWPGPLDPAALARRVLRLLDHWSLPRAAVVGIDMGGPPALALAAAHPDRVTSVAVLNSLVVSEAPTSLQIRLLRRRRLNALLLRHLEGLVFRHAARTSGARPHGDVRADFRRSFRRRLVRETVIGMCAAYQRALPSLRPAYAAVRCPAFALWGERDAHFPPAQAERLRALLPSLRVERIAGAGHWMPLSHPAETARWLEDLLAAAASRQPS